MFEKSLVRQNKTIFAISLFLILFTGFHFIKPDFAYGKDGEFRQFGVGYRNKTVIPIWLISIIVSILSYLIVLYYLQY
jgi:cytochrome b subunit of formate dehydrogenase